MVTSRSAVLRAPDAPYLLEDVELDAPGPDEALVRVVACGICHTDDFGRSGLLGEHFLPAVLGHEASGVVEEVGPGVTHVRPGDHVVLTFDACGTCTACVSANPTCCSEFELRNLTGARPDGSQAARDGTGAPLTSRWFGQSAFGQYAVATARNLVTVPDDVPLELLGPLGCGIQTGAGTVLNVLRPGPGCSIAVFGTGAVGLSAVMAAKLAGADEIVAVDIRPQRRELALELGATRVVDGGDPALAVAVRGDGPGLDCTFDTTGLAAVMTAAVEVLRRPGTAALAGAGLELLTVHPAFLAGKTVTYVYEGGGLPRVLIPQLVEWWRAGRFPFDRLVRTYPLAAINEAEADAQAGRTVKPVLLMPPVTPPGEG
ncbi:NAD(P)-dependent alcohol dehydrogenase [Spongisporangium articulatum]|uniref:NAD(P)-dependent alcohol dehydrogenase n=1 Tax=Spongisporangium articulatum TaxID=3362603 RepID=A0ABW8ATK4_9ACTN